MINLQATRHGNSVAIYSNILICGKEDTAPQRSTVFLRILFKREAAAFWLASSFLQVYRLTPCRRVFLSLQFRNRQLNILCDRAWASSRRIGLRHDSGCNQRSVSPILSSVSQCVFEGF